ncbi:MAG: MBOAT family O-acyltransferase [Oscillospiraceae bacterium]
MVFSGTAFLFAFLPIVLILYYLSNTKIKNIIILISGLFFYAWGEPVYVLIMLLSTVVDYTAGILMDKYDDNKRLRTIFLVSSLIINLGLLSLFKYSSFFITNMNSIFGLNIIDPSLRLPVGISFYTFQSMSYTIDLYMRNIKVQKSIINFTSYVSLFPQIVAGPIVRYSDVQNEIDHRTVTQAKVADGIGWFIRGLAKKLILANNIGAVWTSVKAMQYSELSVLTAWVGILAFTFQIYYDFSGYSDMARGLGKMLGFEFPINFNYPYISKNISDFWRRWHITLGSWFRSYVYFPLGGNRKGTLCTVRNLLIVWFLTGLWHGASWNFVIWGLYFGVIIIMERLFLQKWLSKLPTWLQQLYSFLLVVFGWVLFEIQSFSQIGAFFGAMFGANHTGIFDNQGIYLLTSNIVMFIICFIASRGNLTHKVSTISDKYPRAMSAVKTTFLIVLFIVCIAYLVNASYNPFLYFRF